MIEFVELRSNDDPPIVGLRLSGEDSARDLSAWLSEQKDVRKIELDLEDGAVLRPDEIERLSWKYGVGIRVSSETYDEETLEE